MTYLITFLEGIITFVSPCLLPMIPIYVTYFAAGEEVRTSIVLRNALGFVLGFTCVFIAMGALASSVGAFFIEYQSAVNVVCGLVVIAFGLYFLGIIKINLFHGAKNPLAGRQLGFFSSEAWRWAAARATGRTGRTIQLAKARARAKAPKMLRPPRVLLWTSASAP